MQILPRTLVGQTGLTTVLILPGSISRLVPRIRGELLHLSLSLQLASYLQLQFQLIVSQKRRLNHHGDSKREAHNRIGGRITAVLLYPSSGFPASPVPYLKGNISASACIPRHPLHPAGNKRLFSSSSSVSMASKSRIAQKNLAARPPAPYPVASRI